MEWGEVAWGGGVCIDLTMSCGWLLSSLPFQSLSTKCYVPKVFFFLCYCFVFYSGGIRCMFSHFALFVSMAMLRGGDSYCWVFRQPLLAGKVNWTSELTPNGEKATQTVPHKQRKTRRQCRAFIPAVLLGGKAEWMRLQKWKIICFSVSMSQSGRHYAEKGFVAHCPCVISCWERFFSGECD